MDFKTTKDSQAGHGGGHCFGISIICAGANVFCEIGKADKADTKRQKKDVVL